MGQPAKAIGAVVIVTMLGFFGSAYLPRLLGEIGAMDSLPVGPAQALIMVLVASLFLTLIAGRPTGGK